jgi:WD40 repeat protein/serine/threonine protein kinase
MTPAPDPDDLEDLVGRIADDFTDRIHRGERPDPEEYVRRHPEAADVLRQVLPAVRALGVTPSLHAPIDEPPPAAVGPYEVLGVLGRGGMGVVYQARDTRLGRVVALKMLRADGEDRERLLLEGRSVARLRHPNIVPVYEVGEHAGRPYLALEYVAGGSLAEYLAAHRPTPTQAAALIESVAAAVHAAHEAGIVHRDLKPGNILLSQVVKSQVVKSSGPDGGSRLDDLRLDDLTTPKVTDFGLAKRLGEAAGDRTRTGAIVGTPGYMAPEQAGGGRLVGPAADVYALGAVLYECLTGRPPFEGDSTLEVLERVRTADPVRPRRLDRAIPRDLETVCLKCLQKAPHERYATAAELADDLRRFREGRPVLARPVGSVERAVKWVRRRPTAAAAYGLLGLAVLFAGLGGGATWLWQQAEGARGEAETARDEARGLREQAEAGLAREEALRTELDRLNTIRQIDLAHRDWLADDLGAGLDRLRLAAAAPHRGWEWGYVHHLYHGGFRRPTMPDRGLANDATLSPDGRYLALRWGSRPGPADEVLVWDLATPADDPTARLRAAARVTVAAFGPTGPTLYLGTEAGAVERWDVMSGKRLDARQLQDHPVLGLAVGPGGREVATSGLKDQRVTLWAWADGRELRRFDAAAGLRGAFTLTPDWGKLAAPARGDEVKVWDTKTGAELLTFPDLPAVGGLAFDPAGELLAGTARGGMKVWARDARTGREVFDHRPAAATPAAVFDPDGRLVAADGAAVRTWDARAGRPGRVFRGPSGPVTLLAVGGRRVAAVAAFREPFVWDADADPERVTVRPPAARSVIAFRTRTGELATYGDRAVRLWDPTTGKPVRAFDDHPDSVFHLAFSPDGRLMATGCVDGTVKVWDADGGAVRLTLPQRADKVLGVAFGPDARLLAVAIANRVVEVWDLRTGAMRWNWAGLPAPADALYFTADGRHLSAATGHWSDSPAEGSVHVWDVETGAAVSSGASPELVNRGRAFTPDGRHVISLAVSGREVEVRDARTGDRVRVHSRLRFPATHLALHPDGSRFATAESDGRVRVWDVASGEECLALRLPAPDVPWRVSFGPDGRRLAVACFSGVVHVFDAPPLPPGDPTPVREPTAVPGIHGGTVLKGPH